MLRKDYLAREILAKTKIFAYKYKISSVHLLSVHTTSILNGRKVGLDITRSLDSSLASITTRNIRDRRY